MLSVSVICFEERFCASKKVGKGEVDGFQHRVPCTWQLPCLAVENLGVALPGPFLTSVQMGIETALSAYQEVLSSFEHWINCAN